MLAKLRSLAVLGIDAFEIGIEADTSEMLWIDHCRAPGQCSAGIT